MSVPRITQLLEPISVAPADATSANAYADVDGSLIDSAGKSKVCYTITNSHVANSIDWKVLASIDNDTFVEVEAEATVAAAGVDSWEASATEVSYRYFKVQIKSTAGGSHGTAVVRGYAKF